jgi:hypothetical protein
MRQHAIDTTNVPGTKSPEGRPDMDLPGADPAPRLDPQDDLPERLGQRIEREPTGIATGEPDLLPDVELPDGQM